MYDVCPASIIIIIIIIIIITTLVLLKRDDDMRIIMWCSASSCSMHADDAKSLRNHENIVKGRRSLHSILHCRLLLYAFHGFFN